MPSFGIPALLPRSLVPLGCHLMSLWLWSPLSLLKLGLIKIPTAEEWTHKHLETVWLLCLVSTIIIWD